MDQSRIKSSKIEKISCPRILISALRGSSAKTIISLGVTVAFKRQGITIFPYKKGPDYIDAAWLTKAAGNVCKHLDLYLMGEEGVREVFYSRIHAEAVSLVEGNRGLFDGVDIHGTYSTAKIARLLEIPVVLIVDCTKTTNTVAALVMGCQDFDVKVPLCGIILNRVAGKRHGEVISASIEYHTGLPVLGIVPNLEIHMPERHLGLTTVGETVDFENKLDILGDLVEKYLNLDVMLKIAKGATKIDLPTRKQKIRPQGDHKHKLLVGIIRDPAFQFYYPENLEALEREGAKLIEFSSIKDKEIKPVDILYIAGGFPEVHADKISKNRSFCDSIRHYADKGMPIYGECGAVIFLGNSVNYNGNKFEMCRVFPFDFEFSKKPVGHGYTDVKVDQDNPFFPKGLALKGHEFHYSMPINPDSITKNTAFCMKKGVGLTGKRDGIFINNVFATYTHIHACGTPEWAKCLISLARKINFTKKHNHVI
jgi:cobyrinic acid a,c-diamide synthase